MNRPIAFFIAACASSVACSSSSPGVSAPDGAAPDAQNDVSTPLVDGGHDAAQDAAGDVGGDVAQDGPQDAGGMTIAKARQGNVTTPITVSGFVTALAGVPNDYPIWYIEDPAGGPSSGIAVYCDPLVSSPCTVPEPALSDLIQVTGSISAYKGQLELIPTAMKVVQSNATFPPIATLTAADLAPSANSPYRGVFVKLAIGSKLTVDSVTPAALFDTACGTAPTDGGTGPDGGLPQCSPVCEPPVYSGFRANDGTGNEVYVEAPFFNTDPLQSSPECLTQAGVTPVTVGMTFSSMSGVLDFDPYAMAQALSPVLPADYVSP
jgi:hypothetical protein